MQELTAIRLASLWTDLMSRKALNRELVNIFRRFSFFEGLRAPSAYLGRSGCRKWIADWVVITFRISMQQHVLRSGYRALQLLPKRVAFRRWEAKKRSLLTCAIPRAELFPGEFVSGVSNDSSAAKQHSMCDTRHTYNGLIIRRNFHKVGVPVWRQAFPGNLFWCPLFSAIAKSY